MSNLEMFKYTWTWYKHSAPNFLNAKTMPLKVTEDICVFGFNPVSYNKKDGGFTKTSRYDQALHFTYDEYLDLYDEFQALHKEYMVLPKITNSGKPWSGKAKDVDGQESVEGTLRLKND